MTELDKMDPDNKTNKLKKHISSELERKAKLGELKTREDLIVYLKKSGFEITRKGKDYISVKHKKAQKATRLRGLAFSENADYQVLINKYENSPKMTDPERAEIKRRLGRAIKNRRLSLYKQFNEDIKNNENELKNIVLNKDYIKSNSNENGINYLTSPILYEGKGLKIR